MTCLAEKDRLHIMLADDDEDDREIFEEVFRGLLPEIKFSQAETGDELISKLHKETPLPDLIILDLNMPTRNGLECLEEIRSHVKFAHVPVVVYSTTANNDHVEKAFNKGANLYLQKPSNFPGIKKLIERILGLRPIEYIPQAARHDFLLQD